MNSKHTPGPWVASLDKSRPALPLWLIGAPVSAELPAEAPRHIGNVYAEANARLIAEAPAMLEALRWALGALEKCPPPKEKRGNLDTVAAGAWHGRARCDIQRIIARIDGEPASSPETCEACGFYKLAAPTDDSCDCPPTAQPAGAISEAGRPTYAQLAAAVQDAAEWFASGGEIAGCAIDESEIAARLAQVAGATPSYEAGGDALAAALAALRQIAEHAGAQADNPDASHRGAWHTVQRIAEKAAIGEAGRPDPAEALRAARSFIEGFEGDELQDGEPERILALIDAATGGEG